MIPTIVFTWSGMLNPNIGVEESQQIGFIFKAHDKNPTNEVLSVRPTVDRYLESLHLPDGDVVVDNGEPTAVCPR